MDVAAWLKNLDLGQYEAAFRDNAIDGDLLPSLTAEDLKDLGVTIVGHRRKLLDAIATLGAYKPAASPAANPPAALSAPALSDRPQLRSGGDAERRPIAVMFCDLVGSTSLAERLDPEDWRELVNAYLDEASAAVTGFGGHVLKRLGDGLMALFGYPQAQENDAERAVRAALAIQRSLAELNARNAGKGAAELAARIGLESGLVVVDTSGEIFGDAPNIAARVQAVAKPGSVLVTRNVQRQVAGLFVTEEQGARELKGVSTPVQLFRIVRASGGSRRGGVRPLTSFVGRDEELRLLTHRWERARAGEGQFVRIVGEPGLGKSRIIEEFRARLAETPHTWVGWSASQLLQNTPLHPIAEWGRQRFGADAPAEQRLADLEGTLRLIGLDPAEHAPLLAPLVDIPLAPGRGTHFLPEELRRKQLGAVIAWLLAGARSQPVVLAFEDLHWADPTSLDLLHAIADRGAQAPLLMLASTRPEFRPPWTPRSHHSLIALSPLDRAGVARMVGEISPSHALSKEVIEGVSARTGGVPLFIEEVTRLLLERGEQGGVQAIPPTLQQSLAARLDRLGPARAVAQIGAVLGRDFAYSLLRDVADAGDPALQSSLERLSEADLLFVEGAPPQANYRFKHALIQDAAYDSLLKSRRQVLHQRAAEVLRDQAERAAAEPEVVAHHFTKAGLDDLAIEWWGKAGGKALSSSAFEEAIAHLGKAIAMADKSERELESRGAGAVAPSLRLKLESDYGRAVIWSKGYAAEEAKAAFARADQLVAQSGDRARRNAIYYGQWSNHFVRGELNLADKTAESFLCEAEADGQKMEAVRARLCLGFTRLFEGEVAPARRLIEHALAEHSPDWDLDSRQMFGTDTRTLAVSYQALSMWASGDAGSAQLLFAQEVSRARESGHVTAIINTYTHKILLDAFQTDPVAALDNAEALMKTAKDHNLAFHATYAQFFLSWARNSLSGPEAGASEPRQALTAYLEQGNKIGAPLFHELIAGLEARDNADGALSCLDEGLAIAQETGEHWTDPLLLRRKGQILFLRDPSKPAPAEEAFQAAISVAQRQGSRSFGLRAAHSLAKLYQSTDRRTDALAILAPALEGFAPTPEMPEIAEAQALLERLA